jgi:predicted ferric reductase
VATAPARHRHPTQRDLRLRAWTIGYLAVLLTPLVLMLASSFTEDSWTVLAVSVGFVAYAGMALQVVLVSRARTVTTAVGTDLLVRVHRAVGIALVGLVSLHVAVLFVHSPWCRSWLWPFPGPTIAVAGTSAFAAMLLLGLTSTARRALHLSYETWRVVHVALTGVAMLGGYVHVLYASDFSWSMPLRLLSMALLLVATAGLVNLRLVRAAAVADTRWRLHAVRPERGGATTLELVADGHRGVDFRPGQFAWLKAHGRAYSFLEHPFSVASSTHDPARVAFTVKASGGTSGALAALPVGTTLLLDGPHGGMHEAVPGGGYLLVVAGIGITPAMSVVRSLAARGEQRPVLLVHGIRDERDATFDAELRDLRGRMPLDVVHVVSRPSGTWRGATGRIDRALLAGLLPADRALRNVLVCGPTGFADDVTRALVALGVPAAHVHAERFTSA